MKAAKKLEMLNGNFAFLTLDLSSDVFYTGGQWTGNTEGRTADFSQELNGIIDLSVHRPTVTEEFKRQYKDMESKLPIDVRTLLDAKVGNHTIPSMTSILLIQEQSWTYLLSFSAITASADPIRTLKQFRACSPGKI